MTTDRLSINEAAKYSGYSVASLRYRRLNDLPPASFKRGGRVVYERAELDAFMEQEKLETTRGRA